MARERGPWAWAAVVVPVWVVLALCTHWEPVVRDSWGHVSWHHLIGLSAHNLWEFAKGSYLHNNPRLGQVLTLLLFTPGPWHPIVTPVLELGLFLLLTTLVLGRWPSVRRADDALVFATILALVAITSPVIGPMLFYRPYTGNYLCGLAIDLALLVPYRLHAEAPRRWRWWWAAPMLVLGAAAGLCNEHTGPAFVAVLVFAVVAFWKRGERPAPWMIAGIVGLIAGGLALLLAPGQDVRYNALATQHSLLGRITSRGAAGNLKIFWDAVRFLWPAAVWIALGFAARGASPERTRARRVAELAAVGAALAIVATLLASPKQGERLYFASTALACAALASWLVPRLDSVREQAIAWALAGCVLAYVGWRCVPIYRVLGAEYTARIAEIEHAPRGSTVVVPHYTFGRSRWFLGDDFEVATHRQSLADGFGLKAIELTDGQRAAPPAADDP
jgi:hypothetical protein